jgi:phenylpropionate dioxygenase-like ring-hydroxylating dioxygenase large terminal subunit
MLKNLWYVARPSADVGSQPVPVRLLGQDLVLFRGGDGRVACLSDVCIHRGASLSRGTVADGCVECPYHGWRYAPDGRVTRIPAEPDLKIPPRARIDSYPTHEKHGWIWVFVGDLPESQRPAPPAMPECDDSSIRWIGGSWDWSANYHRVVENGLDFAHAPFVHGSAFGDRNNPAIDDFSVEESETGARSRMVMRVPRNIRGLWSFLYREKLTVVESRPWYDVNGPVVGLELFPRPGWQIWLRSAHTPVDENTTRTWWLMGRNFMKAAMFDKDSVKRNQKIFHQDTVVLEKIKPEQVPDSWREELTVRTDALQVSYRRKVRALEARGWKIDTRRIEAEFRGRRACVLPSPARGDASQPFVLETVPFTGSDADPGVSAPDARPQGSVP